MTQIDRGPNCRFQNNNVTLGALSFSIENGALRNVCWNGVEVLRGLSTAVRDENWGSLIAKNASDTSEQNATKFRLVRTHSHLQGALEVSLTIRAEQSGQIEAAFVMRANRDTLINRAGFNLLHPISGVAGQVAEVRHSDGDVEEFMFPEKISPDQPVTNIVGLRHLVGNCEIAIELAGEVFEMEDQRNWSDASFKTYCRPLSLPFPFLIKKGEIIEQSLKVHIEEAQGASKRIVKAAQAAKAIKPHAPDILLAVQPGWEAAQTLVPSGLLLRIGAGHTYSSEMLARIGKFARSNHAYIDVEIVVHSEIDPVLEIAKVSDLLHSSGIDPRHVISLPESYLLSYQPMGPWPEGTTPAQCAKATAAAFPRAKTGVGMLTNFTELNRCKPANGAGDYITHANSAIVHAADDRSVMETLEAIPHILTSGRDIGEQRGYRLGLFSIAMRSNPYGAALAPNPEQQLKTMTDDDPRQKQLFGAAYAIAIAAEVAHQGVEAVALAAPSGPFGVAGLNGELYPIFHALKALCKIAGRKVELIAPAGANVFGMSFSGGEIIANCTAQSQELQNPPTEGVILDETSVAAASLDENWISRAENTIRNPTVLAPYACLFSGFEVAT